MTIWLKISLFAGGGTLFAGTAYVTAITYAPAPTYKPTDAEREARFNELAPQYEQGTRQQEWYLGIGRLRRRMLKDHAKGRVLEVGAGTGHNIGLYSDDTCTEVVLCDRAPQMVRAMQTKMRLRLGVDAPDYTARLEPAVPSRNVDGEGNATLVPYATAVCSTEQLPFPDNSFDTVVDVFGLCSYDQPVQALREMSRVCKPKGKLVLLEHGRGNWPTVNWYLDKWAPRHANSWGCWWNRDIRRYLRLSGIKTVEREEKHFGTTTLITAKPFKSGDAVAPAAASAGASA